MLSASMKRPLSHTTVVVAPVPIHDEIISSSGSTTETENVAMAEDLTYIRPSYSSMRPPLKRMKCSTLSDMNENSSMEFDCGTFTTDQSMEMEDGELASMNVVYTSTPSQDVDGGVLQQVAQAVASSYNYERNPVVDATSMNPVTVSVLSPSQQLSNTATIPHKRKLRYSSSSTISSCSLAVSQSSIQTERSASNDEYDLVDVESFPTESGLSMNSTAMNDEDPVLIESLVADWSHSFVLQVPKQQRTKSQVQAARRLIHRTHFLSKKQSSLSL
jgi:hypothetical protein